jgi:hypothetical protein
VNSSISDNDARTNVIQIKVRERNITQLYFKFNKNFGVTYSANRRLFQIKNGRLLPLTANVRLGQKCAFDKTH